MAITNYTSKEVQFKIVLYGPPFSGKTTCLTHIQSKIEAESKGEITALKSAADKTLFFEFTPKDATLLEDFKIRFEVFTVPGNVVFNAPRKLVVRDSDGILFVADSEWAKIEENVLSFKNLEENLRKQGSNLDEIPVVLQYNKRDSAGAAPVGYLDYVLNNRNMRIQTFETVATTGQNVFASLRALAQMMIQRFLESSPGQPIGALTGMAGPE